MKSWPPDAWKIGGGGVWGWISYDPQLNLIYYGTANPGPWDAEARPGDNKFTAGIFARDPDTGEAVWFYQFSPHDLYDYDAVNENILLDLPIHGQTRKVLVHPDRNGYVYVMDRTTGEVLSASVFAPITTSRGVDLKTGQLQYVDEKKPITGKVVRGLCPTAPGAKDWQPSAFSPRTGLLYIPHNHLCMDEEDLHAELHRRHALCRRECPHVRRARWLRRRIYRLGPGRRQSRVDDSRSFSGVERSTRHGRRRRFLRHARRMVQSRRRAQRQRCSGNSKPGPELSASPLPTKDRMVNNTSPSCPVSAAGPERSWPAGWMLAMNPRLWDSLAAMKDLPKYTNKGRNALCIRPALSLVAGFFLLLAA